MHYALELIATGILVSIMENLEQVLSLVTKPTWERQPFPKKNPVPLEILDHLTKAVLIFTLLFTAMDLTYYTHGAMMKSYQMIGKIW